MKRLLFLTHRWLGVGLALCMALWFVSGLVIVYATPLNQTRIQQLAHAEALNVEPAWLSLGEAWRLQTAQGKALDSSAGKENGEAALVEARLLRRAGQPVWLVEDSNGKRLALSAVDGRALRFSEKAAGQLAQQWVNASSGQEETAVHFIETVEKPLVVRNQDALRPFHRFAVDDGQGSEIYISARSGDVVHVSTRVERAFYWAGNWLHFFRFLDLAGVSEQRAEILMWSAIAAFAACLSGLIVGWLRWRPGWFGKRSYGEGRVHPYREFWFRWHFWAGLLGGIFALLWTFSGFVNGNTWKLFSAATPSRAELARYYGPGLPGAAAEWLPSARDGLAPDVVELGWRRVGHEAVLSAWKRDGSRQLVVGSGSGIGEAHLLEAVHRLSGGGFAASVYPVTAYDSYYYPRHARTAWDRPLPVLRVELDDPARTHYYVDPLDGRLLLRQDASRRLYRWLFSALHHWDIGPLYVRPVWDAWMLLWVGLGLVLAASSVVIGWRRLQVTFRPRKRQPRDSESRPLVVEES